MFEIVVDSAANIPAVIANKRNIEVISFVNYVDNKPLICFDHTLTPEDERSKSKTYYDAMREGNDIKTGLISSGEFSDFFRRIMSSGKDVLYISLSQNISGTYNSARIAAEYLMDNPPCGKKIRLVDSLNASLGQGILALYASEMRDQGMKIDEVADILEGYSHKMNGIFTVGDLKYLHRTGRITGAKTLVGNLLNIKPILRGNAEGYIVQYHKCRTRRKSLEKLIDLICNNIVDPENQIIGIAHADAYEESLYMMQEIQKRITVREFVNTSYDFCTGSHVGPEAIALFFMGNDRELKK